MPSILTTNVVADWERTLKEQSDEVEFATGLFATVEGVMKLVMAANLEQKVLLTVAVSIMQDYDEVLVMWVHGLGDGATKLIRPLYEKVLTFAYLADNLSEIDDFIEYSKVSWYKIFKEGAIASNNGDDWMDRDERERILKEYDQVRNRYRMTDCRKCQTMKPTASWTKKSAPELARAADPVLRKFYFNGFLAPTLTIHPTFATMTSQVEIVNGELKFNWDLIEQDNNTALGVTLSMAFVTLVTLNKFFGLGQDDVIAEVTEKFETLRRTHARQLGIPSSGL